MLGGALEDDALWDRDDRSSTGTEPFRAVAAGLTDVALSWGEAISGAGPASMFCASGATVSCCGPLRTAGVIGLGGLAGGVNGDWGSDIVIERVL